MSNCLSGLLSTIFRLRRCIVPVIPFLPAHSESDCRTMSITAFLHNPLKAIEALQRLNNLFPIFLNTHIAPFQPRGTYEHLLNGRCLCFALRPTFSALLVCLSALLIRACLATKFRTFGTDFFTDNIMIPFKSGASRCGVLVDLSLIFPCQNRFARALLPVRYAFVPW